MLSTEVFALPWLEEAGQCTWSSTRKAPSFSKKIATESLRAHGEWEIGTVPGRDGPGHLTDIALRGSLGFVCRGS